jgi:hypothetical protein
MSWRRCRPIRYPEITKNVDAREPAGKRFRNCVIEENRQDRERTQAFNIASNSMTARGNSHRGLSLYEPRFGISHLAFKFFEVAICNIKGGPLSPWDPLIDFFWHDAVNPC